MVNWITLLLSVCVTATVTPSNALLRIQGGQLPSELSNAPYMCTSFSSESNSGDGFVPHSITSITCPQHIQPSRFTVSTCSTVCKDPLTGEWLPDIYLGFPVYYTLELLDTAYGNSTTITFAIACKCIDGRRRHRIH